MTVREQTEQIEQEILSPWAAKAGSSRGRARPEEDCPLRTIFQRDRDRVIHCKSFRRLKTKTQVFLSPRGDHYRTRLTHTLEVSQIARTIARALRLNEDLTEAIALAHDLGHTPFGHAGERALSEISGGRFKHYRQSLRVVDRLEKEGEGLNLSWEVRNGIVCHTEGKEPYTAEGRIVRVADRIAYINHDIDDAVRAGVMGEEDIPRGITERIGGSKKERITSLICSVVENSHEGVIAMDPDDFEAYDALHEFMYQAVYRNEYAKSEEKKVPHVIERLYKHFCDPACLPEYMQRIAEEDGRETAAMDYVAGMSDLYAVNTYSDLFIPKAWSHN
ncbi:deoxyguanosinetriphosphate triphosphohydrolase [Acutalibacter muris]|uniref:Deoxyguanosinetriphosphate triphosphohydrolase n=1 Tax=Acutalibacter muris TaxID=1796620 RepID=A0A1Z2XM20_9FIRM|nr:deoxyguanosinetriphosphate triphosphohydrolase [Acutalibacter muris]ANU53839.1 deoxyguanosinetriphosphate triphosphohydrolase [Hungateiclostridiaceae bacterium KB18]ASB39485.1 deoxyguanosinetriphosphate triphosphohydrolase [Acutalibacter muris]QQR32080.1 deoxyguanosinetriphosphate triphosphohydrolase [Acutalibacter muris]